MSAEGGVGGAGTLLAHHLAAIYISWHAATWAPHTKYTSYMAVVEFNTLLLMLKKCAPGKLLRLGLGLGLRLGLALTLTLTGKLLRAVLDKLFLASWLSLRLVWLPPLLSWLCLPCQVRV